MSHSHYSNSMPFGGGTYIIPKKQKPTNEEKKTENKSSNFDGRRFPHPPAGGHGLLPSSVHGLPSSSSTAVGGTSTKPTASEAKLLVWTGSLRFGEQVVESVDLYSPFRDGVKPFGFSTCLGVQLMAQWKDCLKYPPLAELARKKASSPPGLLLKKRVLTLFAGGGPSSSQSAGQSKESVRVSYLYLLNTFSPLFSRLCKDMVVMEHGAFGLLADGSVLVLVTDGDLSARLGLPNRETLGLPTNETPFLHCLFVVPRAELTTAQEPMLTIESFSSAPAPSDKLDGSDPRLVALVEKYQRESGLPVVQRKEPSQLESLISPDKVPPAGGKPPTPNIPTPGSAMRFHQRQQTQFRAAQQPPSLMSLLQPPPPPPFFPPTQKKADDRKQTNNALFAGVFEQLRNRKTEVNNPQTSMSSLAGQQPNKVAGENSAQLSKGGNGPAAATPKPVTGIGRDPRLADPRLAARLAARPPPPPPPLPASPGDRSPVPPPPPPPPPMPADTQSEREGTIAHAMNGKMPMAEREVNHEQVSMEVDESDSIGQPYSPSQAIRSKSNSPEPRKEEEEESAMEMEETREDGEEEGEKGTQMKQPEKMDASGPLQETGMWEEGQRPMTPPTDGSQREKSPSSLFGNSGFGFDYLNWSINDSSDHDRSAQTPSSPPVFPTGSNGVGKKRSTTIPPPSTSSSTEDNDFRQVWSAAKAKECVREGQCTGPPGNNGCGSGGGHSPPAPSRGKSQQSKAAALRNSPSEPMATAEVAESPSSPAADSPPVNPGPKPMPLKNVFLSSPPPTPIFFGGPLPPPTAPLLPLPPRPVHQVRPLFNQQQNDNGIIPMVDQPQSVRFRFHRTDIPPPNFARPPPPFANANNHPKNVSDSDLPQQPTPHAGGSAPKQGITPAAPGVSPPKFPNK